MEREYYIRANFSPLNSLHVRKEKVKRDLFEMLYIHRRLGEVRLHEGGHLVGIDFAKCLTYVANCPRASLSRSKRGAISGPSGCRTNNLAMGAHNLEQYSLSKSHAVWIFSISNSHLILNSWDLLAFPLPSAVRRSLSPATAV
jgi:hypothetical protein